MLASLRDLAASGAVAPRARARCVRAIMTFNDVDARRALELDAALAEAHPTAARHTLAAKRVMWNLQSNPALHAMGADALVHASDEEMARGTFVERVQAEERARYQAHVDMLRETEAAAVRPSAESVLHCPKRKCASADISFVQVQTRSADEPMTCMLTCNTCGHRWRMS